MKNQKLQKTNWRHLLIILIVAFIVGGGILGYQYWWIPREGIKPLEIKPQEEPKNIEKQLERLEKLLKDEIKIEPLVPYKIIRKDFVFQGYMEENITGEGWEYYYEYQGNKFKIKVAPIRQNKYGVVYYNSVLENFDPNTGRYRLISDLGTSGIEVNVYGHKNDLVIKWGYYERIGCCSMPTYDNIFIYNFSNGKSSSKEMDYEASPGRESLVRSFSLFLQKDRLYSRAINEFYLFLQKDGLKSINEYYYSINKPLFEVGVDRYYLLENGEIIEIRERFKNIYLKKAIEYEKILEEKSWKDSNNWLSPLLGRTLNYIFAGEEEKAWKEFFEDFAKLSLKYPLEEIEKIDPNKIKKEIQRQLKKR